MEFSFTPLERTFLTIGSLELKYYGLMYALGALFVFFFTQKVFKKKSIKINNEQMLDLLSYGIFGVILGGRFGYILFYNLSYYLENPLKIIAVWEGGMSFHGGFLGVILAGYLFCKKEKLNFYQIADLAIIPVFIALALGRFGNFINGELVGRITEIPWGMEFEGHEGKRHPSQLYAVGKNLLAFFILLFSLRLKLKKGSYFWGGIMLYGLFRFLVEFTRQPDLHIGFVLNYFTMGQLLSIPMFLLGIFMVVRLNSKRQSPTPSP